MKKPPIIWLAAAIFLLICCLVYLSGAKTAGEIFDSLQLLSVFCVIFAALAFPAILQVQLLRSISDETAMLSATPDAFPQLDTATLESYTQELNSLGFRAVQDFTLHNPTVKMVPLFARFWVHEDGTCYAEASQYFFATKTRPLTLTFISYFGEGPPHQSLLTTQNAPLPSPDLQDSKEAEGERILSLMWTYVTTNAPHGTILRMFRRPQSLHRRMMEAGVRQMYEQHLSDRNEVAACLHLPITSGLTLERYFNWAIWARRAYRWQLRHQIIHLGLLRAFFNKSDAWWGALSSELGKRLT